MDNASTIEPNDGGRNLKKLALIFAEKMNVQVRLVEDASRKRIEPYRIVARNGKF